MLNSRPIAFNGEGSSNLAFARTPAKGLLRNRTAQENAVYLDSMMSTKKGKATLIQTPYRSEPAVGKGAILAQQTITKSMPLGDKTPFPNRQLPMQTPAPQLAKLAKLLDPALAKTPGALLLPSAQRKNLRLPRSASKKFTTPKQQGNYWDVSDGDLDPDVSADDQQQVQVDDYDEIEYMPPKVPEQPYEPPFDMPDYTAGGKALMTIAHTYLMDDTNDLYYAADIETVLDIPTLLRESGGFTVDFDLPPLDDDDASLILLDDFTTPSPQPAPPKSKSRIPTARHTSTPSQSSMGPPRYMTRAASKMRETAASTRTTLHTRSNSRSTASSLGRGAGTPGLDYSTDSSTRTGGSSRPGTSTGIRRPSVVVAHGLPSGLPVAKGHARSDSRSTVAVKEKEKEIMSRSLEFNFAQVADDDFLFEV